MKKIAIITQSYKDDFMECGLLCKSIDIFANTIPHYIFVNDEDYKMFQTYHYGIHKVVKKSTVLPKWLIRFPFKFKGHYFYLSPFTIPARGWIIQQICKLGVFEIIDENIAAVLHIDSESVFMKSFNYNFVVKDKLYMMYRKDFTGEPSHEEYYTAAKHLLKIDKDIPQYEYISGFVCFERENIKKLLETISANNIFRSWKMALCNTFRFSEYYLYGIYVDFILGRKKHFLTDKHLLPIINVADYDDKELFCNRITEIMSDKEVMGIWIQKVNRKTVSKTRKLNFDTIKAILESYWKDKIGE